MNRASAAPGRDEAAGEHDLGSLLDDLTRALSGHARRLLPPPDRPRPVVLPAYGATRHQRNLTALLALLLKRYGISVLVHAADVGVAPADASPRVATADVLRELGIEPAATLADAQARLRRDDLALVPLDVLAPGFARLARADACADGLVPTLARLLDPFGGDGYRIVCAAGRDALAAMRAHLVATRADALLVENAEGEPFPEAQAPRLEAYVAGVANIGADEQPEHVAAVPLAPLGAVATAEWTEQVLAGELPVPAPILAQLGYCLAGVRR